MKKIAIDSNVLNILSKISSNPKVDEDKLHEVIKKNDIYVSSIVIHEMFLHNRDNPDNLMKFLDTCRNPDYGIKVFRTGEANVMEPILFDLSFDLPQATDSLDDMLVDRIKSEASQAVLIYEQIMYFFALAVLNTKKDERVQKSLSGFIEIFLVSEKEMVPEWMQYFRRSLENAYETSNPDKYFKESMNHLVADNCERFITIVNGIEDSIMSDAHPDVITAEYEDKLKSKEKFYKLKKQYPSNISAVLSRYISDSQTSISKLRTITFDKFPKQADARDNGVWFDYLISITERVCHLGEKVSKDDISDSLLLSVVDYKDFYLLTFEDRLIGYIKSVHPQSFMEISALYDKGNLAIRNY